MPLKGENPITSYFPRVSPNTKLKTPIQSKSTLAKRVRSPNEIDSATKGTFRKKSKSQRHSNADHCIVLHAPSSSSQATFVRTASAKDVIEIQETPPGSPCKVHQSTPLSSPLPLTPSPPKTRSPTHLSDFDGAVDDAEASYLEPREADPNLIPSSQAQAIDAYSYEYEGSKMPQDTAPPLPSTPVRSPQISSYIPVSQPDITPLELTLEELVPSSQSQFMGSIPTSLAIPDFDTVPSSQSQEFFYSQHTHNSQKKRSDTSRTSLMDFFTGESEARAQSENGEHSTSGICPGSTTMDVEEPHLHAAIPSTQTPACTSGPSSSNYKGEETPSTQSIQDCLSDEAGLYESLPDAVKDFRGMFGDTFESLPPDFPMSLRF